MSKISFYFLLLFVSAGAVFAQQKGSETEVNPACIDDPKLSSLKLNCLQSIDPITNIKVQKTCAQDIQYCSDKIICFLATVKRNGKRFWTTSKNRSKYLSEASQRDLACGKLPPKLQEPPLSSDAPQSDSIALALEEALNAPGPETATPSSTSGLQMTSGEKTAIQRHLKPCWAADPGSFSQDIIVTLRWEMLPDGKLVAGSLRMIDSEGGEGSALRRAIQIAKSAVFRCGNKMGANLPPEKYDQWQEIEVRFDPSNMRIQ